MIDKNVGYGYNDLCIVPAVLSDIKSRNECNPFYENNMLPIFASPMGAVVNKYNFALWEKNNIIPVLPRNVDYNTRIDYLQNEKWVALSLTEFCDIFCNDASNIIIEENKTYYVCVDLANGHMKSLLESCSKAKNRYNNLVIMTGNIANPVTYIEYCEAGIDYVRCSIGSGSCCTTASNTAVHYPIASLINVINTIKCDRQSNNVFCTKVIADGGIRNYSDVIKALALGADYVMVGGLFVSILESAGEIIDGDKLIDFDKPKDYEYDIKILNQYYDADFLFNKIIIKGPLSMSDKFDIYKDCEGVETLKVALNGGLLQYYFIFDIYNPNLHEAIKRAIVDLYNFKKRVYGMSTKTAQRMIKPEAEMKTAEGIEKTVNVTYTMKQWVDNMIAYIKSTMSYCNAKTLFDFIGKQKLKVQSNSEIFAVNK